MTTDNDAPAAGLVDDEGHVWPTKLRIRDTKLHDDMGGSGQRIYTTAGRGYKTVEYVRADLASLQAPQEAGLVRDLQLLLESYTAYAGDAVPASIIERSRELHARLSALSQPVATPTPRPQLGTIPNYPEYDNARIK